MIRIVFKSTAKIIFVLIFAIFILLHSAITADSNEIKDKSFSLYMENDSPNRTDSYYTNGIKLTWLVQNLMNYKESGRLPEWSLPIIDRLPFINIEGSRKDLSLSVGQNIYTPEDISRSDLIEDDRPYAGITYVAAGFHSKTIDTIRTMEIYLGIVGPHSFAEETQKIFHGIIGSSEPQGWEHQLNDEPVLGLIYEQKRKLYRNQLSRKISFDFSVHMGGGLGNAYIYLNTGAGSRVGWNLPHDFGICRISPASCDNPLYDSQDASFSQTHKLSLYFFVKVDGQAVARDIFLDGNTFRNSHSVDKEPFVADVMGGVAVSYKNWRFSVATLARSRMFKTQQYDQKYTSMSITVSY